MSAGTVEQARATRLSGLARNVEAVAGHGSPSTTQRYLHPDASTIAAAGESLTAYLRAPRSPGGPRLRGLPSAADEAPTMKKAR